MNQQFKEQYSKFAIGNLTQILTNSHCTLEVADRDTSQGPIALVQQPCPVGSVVVIWDVFLAKPGARRGPYIGTVRLEFGSHIDVQSTVKALHGIEGQLHQAWLNSPLAAWPGTAKALPAWCMAPEGAQ